MTDLITISLSAGNGGKGHVSFRRTKQVTKGGPDGGNGGNGGDVVVEAREDIRDLNELKGKAKFIAGTGGDGGKNGLDGKRGEDLVIKVPIGTIVRKTTAEGVIEADLDVDGDKVTVLAGGMGGRGNRSFSSSNNRTPILAEAGEAGETSAVELELRLDAEAAILGGTQLGKSTLLNLLTNTGVEEREYSYSTPEPVAGVITIRGKDRKVIEIPGLFREGDEKFGPGVRYLRHAEKASLLILMVGEGSLKDEAKRLQETLSEYWPSLLAKEQIYVRANRQTGKFDLYSKGLVQILKNVPKEALKDSLLGEISKIEIRSRTRAKHYDMSRLKNRDRLQQESPRVEKLDDQFLVKSTLAEMLARGTDLNTWEAQSQFRGQITDWKIARLMEAQGIKEGDQVRIANKVIKW